MVLSRIAFVSTISILSVSVGLTPPEPPSVSADSQAPQGVAIADVEAAQTLGGEFTMIECVFGGLGVSVGALHAGAFVLAVGGPVAWGAGLIGAGVVIGGAIAAC